MSSKKIQEDHERALRIVAAGAAGPAEAYAMIHDVHGYREAPELAAYSGSKCYACEKCGCRLPGQLGFGPPCNCANEMTKRMSQEG